MKKSPLAWSSIVVYSVPAATVGFMSSLISFYLLKFSTDVLLIAPALMGLFFGLSRIWDAVTDPVVGFWSDRTQSRIGRRRPWLLVSALPLALVFVGLWSPPTDLHGSALAVWMGVGIVLFYTAQTVLNVPHASLGAELTDDHHDRTRVFAGRMVLDLTGVLLAAGALVGLERAEGPRSVATAVAIVAALASIVLILWPTARLRERPEYQGRGGSSPYVAFGDVLRNPHARVLLAVFFLEALGFSSLVTVMPYTTQYVLDLDGMTGVFIGSSIVVMVLSIPAWLPLSRRYGKRNLWIFSMFVRAAAFMGMGFIQPGEWVPIMVSIALIGSAHGCGNMLGPSLKADVIDYDEYRTGQRKEGAYFATWNLSLKAAAGCGIFLTGGVLQLSGFQPNVEQTETTRLAMRLLMAGFPCLFFTIAGLLTLRFSLSESEHGAIREEIDRRAHLAAARLD